MAYYIKKFTNRGEYEAFINAGNVLPVVSYIVDEGLVEFDSNITPDEDVDYVKEAVQRQGSTLIIPKGTTKVGEYAFRACPYTKIVVPEGVTSIGANSFRASKNANTVSLPSTIRSIGATAFDTRTASITLLATTPPTLASGGIKSTTTIYVPAQSVSAYQAANVWKTLTINAIQETL